MIRGRELRQLLHAIEQVRRLGVQDRLRVQRILDDELSRDREDLRTALASALSRNQEEWERIAEHFDKCVGPDAIDSRPGTGTEQLDAAQPLRRRWRRWVVVGL